MNRRTALGLLAAAPVAIAATPGLFSPAPSPGGAVSAEPEALAKVAADLLRWMATNPADPVPIDPRVRATLDWVVETAAADRLAPTQRLEDPEFLANALDFAAWTPDRAAATARGVALAPDQIRLTKYLAWRFTGRRAKEPGFEHALYEVPADEVGRASGDVAGRTDLLRLKFTRRQLLDGAYEAGGPAAGQARPLAWMSRPQVHEALMQGTVVVDFPDGTVTLNVHRNNGMAWKPELAREPERQDRVWYFREVAGLCGYGADDKVRLEPRVVVAGDVASLGLGGLYALTWGDGSAARMRLVLLADTGGAFHPNLFQLDWLVGTFALRADFEREARDVPDRVRAFALTLR